MDATTKETLVKAIQLIKSGDRKSAVPLLANVLKTEPNLVQAWYLLGLAVDSETQKIKSFKQALKLDPSHEKARQALAKIETPPPVPEIIPEPEPEPEPFQAETEEPAPERDKFATGPLDDSILEYQNGFDDRSDAEKAVGVHPEAARFGDAPEMDLRAELGNQQSAEKAPHASGDEYALPDWMSESTFDPSEYQTDQPAADIYENTEADIPEWAKKNPFSEQAAPEEPDPQADMPAWAKMIPPKDQRQSDQEPVDEESEHDLPSWAIPDESYGDDERSDSARGSESDIDRVAAFFEQQDTEGGDLSEGEAPEEPEWLRGMVVGEDDDKKKKSRRKELTPSQKKKRRQTIVRLLLLVIIIGGAAGGFFFREELQPLWARVKPYTDIVVNPVKTIAAPATDLLTQGAPLTYLLTPDYNVTPTITNTPPVQPTAEPTRTPQPTEVPPTATIRPTLSPDETPTVTPTSSPLPNEIEAQMKEIETQIEIMRGLTGPANLSREFVNQSRLRQDMEQQLIDAERLDYFEDEIKLLTALGFIRGSVNLADPLLSTYADAVGGYYSPAAKKVLLIGSYFDGFSEVEQFIYAQVYAHALQDSNFNLSNLGYFPICSKAAQSCQAINALVKGEAALVTQLWLEQNPPDNILEITNYEYSPSLFGPAEPAPFFTQNATFATTHGLAFAEYLYNNGSWSAVNRAFNILPSTTEQILHPEKYQQGEEAGGIAYPTYVDLLGQPWELVREDSLGEWYTYLLLGFNDYSLAQRPENEAAIAAAGWNVDRYQLYYNPEQRETFLSVYWIWDTEEDSNQFYSSLLASLDARFGGAAEDSADSGICWSYGGERSCIQQEGSKVYWLLSDNAEMLNLVQERFKVFP